MIKYLQVCLLLLIFTQLKGQNYDRAFGVRAGVTSGIEYKKFMDYEKAVEALISFKRGGVQFTYLKTYHQPIMLFTEGKMFFYFGFGSHFGYSRWSSEKYFFGGYTYKKRETEFAMGVDGKLGIEYQFSRNPFIVSFDYKPYVEISYPVSLGTNNYDFAVSIKYSF